METLNEILMCQRRDTNHRLPGLGGRRSMQLSTKHSLQEKVNDFRKASEG
jgi:hypothetical protein